MSNRVEDAYIAGFSKRCEEAGIDPEALVKSAQDLNWLQRIFYTGKEHGATGKSVQPGDRQKARQAGQKAVQKAETDKAKKKTKKQLGAESQAAQRQEALGQD